jgi:hypothetical protein
MVVRLCLNWGYPLAAYTEQVKMKHFRFGACMFHSQFLQSPALQCNNGKDTQGYNYKYGYLFHAGCFLKRRPGTEKVAKR